MKKPVSEKDLIQLITGECSPEERERIERWIEEKPENREQLSDLRKTWQVAGFFELRHQEDESWEMISERISNPGHLTLHRLGRDLDARKKDQTGQPGKRMHPGFAESGSRYSSNWLGRIAVICLIVVGMMYLLNSYGLIGGEGQPNEPDMQEIVADRGERMNLTLSDGTSVVLNSSSAIRYPSHFNSQSREIELEGEAFFSVSRNENKPFLVHTDRATVRVLGTKFNVNAYNELDGVEVVVEDGEVAVKADSLPDNQGRNASNHAEVVLGKGEYTIVRDGTAPTPPTTVSLDRHLGWINGDLIFEAAPLDIVIQKLERYYDRDFQIADSSLLDHKLTVSFKKESLTKVLDVLSIAMDIKYEQRDSLIYLESYNK